MKFWYFTAINPNDNTVCTTGVIGSDNNFFPLMEALKQAGDNFRLNFQVEISEEAYNEWKSNSSM